MELKYPQTYFLNEHNQVVEISEVTTDANPFENTFANFAWGENFKDAKLQMGDWIYTDTFNAISDKISNFMENKYNIKTGLDATLKAEVYDKETGEFIFGTNKNLDKDEVIYKLMKSEFADEHGALQFGEMLEYCENNNIDVSDIILYEEVSSNWHKNQCGIVFIQENDLKEFFEVENINEIYPPEILTMLEAYVELGEAYINGIEYGYVTYELTGEEVDDWNGFFGRDTKTNGIEDYTGELTECLGFYNSINECFEKNQEKFGIVVEPIPSLMDRIKVAEEKSDKSISSKSEKEIDNSQLYNTETDRHTEDIIDNVYTAKTFTVSVSKPEIVSDGFQGNGWISIDPDSDISFKYLYYIDSGSIGYNVESDDFYQYEEEVNEEVKYAVSKFLSQIKETFSLEDKLAAAEKKSSMQKSISNDSLKSDKDYDPFDW